MRRITIYGFAAAVLFLLGVFLLHVGTFSAAAPENGETALSVAQPGSAPRLVVLQPAPTLRTEYEIENYYVPGTQEAHVEPPAPRADDSSNRFVSRAGHRDVRVCFNGYRANERATIVGRLPPGRATRPAYCHDQTAHGPSE